MTSFLDSSSLRGGNRRDRDRDRDRERVRSRAREKDGKRGAKARNNQIAVPGLARGSGQPVKGKKRTTTTALERLRAARSEESDSSSSESSEETAMVVEEPHGSKRRAKFEPDDPSSSEEEVDETEEADAEGNEADSEGEEGSDGEGSEDDLDIEEDEQPVRKRPARKGAPPKKRQRRGLATMVGLRAAVKGRVVEGKLKGKNNYTGKFEPKSKVSTDRPFDHKRVEQILRHISTAFFNYIKANIDKSNEQEVETMFVNGRIFLSSNAADSIALFKGISQDQLLELFNEATNGEDERSTRVALKLRAVLNGTRLEDLKMSVEERAEMTAIAEMLRNAISEPSKFLVEGSAESAAAWVGDEEHKGKLILVKPPGKRHAEQTLVLTYVNSGSKSLARVYGKKRPCMGCYMTLEFAKIHLGAKLEFSGNPGGLFGTALPGLMDLIHHNGTMKVEDVDKFVLDYFKHTHETSSRGGDPERDWGSGSESEGEEKTPKYKAPSPRRIVTGKRQK